MKDKVALITGAAKRVGACIAKQLHAEGIRVIVHYRGSASSAEQLVGTLNGMRENSASLLCADLNDLSSIATIAQEACAIWGHVDILVNNASSFFPTPFGEVNLETWNDLFNSNVRAPFFLSQALLPSLKLNQGCIVNMVDVHADRPMKDHAVYCMAKAALVSMTKALAKDLAPEVRVNGIAPGMVLWPDETPLDPQAEKYLLNRIPLKRFGSPQNIAEAVSFIVKQNYMTGHILNIDGGRTLTI